MSDSRMAFFLDFIGGPDNLPPQLALTKTPGKRAAADAHSIDEEEDEPPPIERDPNLIPPSQLLPDVPPACRKAALTMDPFGNEFHALNVDGRKGEPAPLGISFTPFAALTKYCYKFVPRQWMQPLASAFFDQDKIYQRDWDLYFVHTESSGVVFFVPENQLYTLVAEINCKFPTAGLTIGQEERDNHLVIDFEDLPQEYRPRWLGRCNSRPQHNSWLFQLQHEPATVLPASDNHNVAIFQAKMDEAREASKRNRASKGKTDQETFVRHQGSMRQTLHAQRFLGMLPKVEDSLMPDISKLTVTSFDPSCPVPYSPEQEPIFIAIDVEAWENPPRMITEVGVATLDTRDLKGIAPGDIGKNWHEHIRSRHFRVLEYKDYVNSKYVLGCPDSFEFGHSELVSNNSIASVLASCFREPYSQKQSISDEDQLSAIAEQEETRHLVVVGHDLGQDIHYCQQLGFSIFNRGNIIDMVDTLKMYRAYTKGTNPCSLGSILYDFDISAWHLHNAGNDAVYTIQAMLAICIQSASPRSRNDIRTAREKELEQLNASLAESAAEDAEQHWCGWESADGDEGGVALSPIEEDSGPKPIRKARGRSKGKEDSGLYTLMGNPLDV